jgi:hypothetical protein
MSKTVPAKYLPQLPAIPPQRVIPMARRLSSSIRHSDVLARWGGEEFLLVPRYTDRREAGSGLISNSATTREAELLAERVLAAIADTPFVLRNPEETITHASGTGGPFSEVFTGPGQPAFVRVFENREGEAIPDCYDSSNEIGSGHAPMSRKYCEASGTPTAT